MHCSVTELCGHAPGDMTTDAAPREQPPTEGQLRRQMEQGLKRLGLVMLGGVLTLLGVLALILTLEPSNGALKNMLAGGGVPVWVWLMVVAVYVWMIWTCAAVSCSPDAAGAPLAGGGGATTRLAGPGLFRLARCGDGREHLDDLALLGGAPPIGRAQPGPGHQSLRPGFACRRMLATPNRTKGRKGHPTQKSSTSFCTSFSSRAT